MKYAISLALAFIAVILGIVVKMVYDNFTNASGILETAGADANTIALSSFIPWAIPMIIFTLIIIMLVRSRRQ